jgi:hypothetical protein
MARKSPQFFLADLMAIIAICGLALGLFSSSGSSGKQGFLLFLIWLVATGWMLVLGFRYSPTCDECGRRFLAQGKKPNSPTVCPQCGQPQLRSARLRRALAIGFWIALALPVLIVALMVSLMSADFTALVRYHFGYFVALPIGLMLLFGLFVVLLIARFVLWTARFNPVPCEKCGAIISRGGTTEPLICHRCRLLNLPSKQAKKENAKGILVLLALLTFIGTFAAFVLGDSQGSPVGVSHWITVPLTIVAPVVVVFGVLFAIVFLRIKRLKGEGYVLKLAGKAAGEEGEVVRSGSTTVWYTGPTNPAPLLLDHMESTRKRLEALTGTDIGSPPFLRILCFRKRRDFEAFVLPFAAHVRHLVKTQSGLYLTQPYRILTICDEQLPHHVNDPDETARSLFCSYFMEILPGNPLAHWVQVGISKWLTSGDDDLSRLNRKMLASLSRGTMLGTHLFEINDQELLKSMKGCDDRRNSQKIDQFQAESWSVFEYLGGKQAPDERRDRLRAFLADKQAKAQPAMVFERHFGFGLDRLAESWRDWVQQQGIGTFVPLPPHIEERLLNRLIPLIENRQANRDDRILAIRRMGSHGYVLGADALIDLLRDRDDAIPREEVTWALEAISGKAYGDDLDRWTAWWHTIPTEIRERRGLSVATSYSGLHPNTTQDAGVVS